MFCFFNQRVYFCSIKQKQTTMTNETFLTSAAQLVILDAIEKGHTNISELANYMQSEGFKNAVANYYKMFETEF